MRPDQYITITAAAVKEIAIFEKYMSTDQKNILLKIIAFSVLRDYKNLKICLNKLVEDELGTALIKYIPWL